MPYQPAEASSKGTTIHNQNKAKTKRKTERGPNNSKAQKTHNCLETSIEISSTDRDPNQPAEVSSTLEYRRHRHLRQPRTSTRSHPLTRYSRHQRRISQLPEEAQENPQATLSKDRQQEDHDGVGNTRVKNKIPTLHTNSRGKMAEDRTEGMMGRGIPTRIEEEDRRRENWEETSREAKRREEEEKREEDSAEKGKREENKRKKRGIRLQPKLESAPEIVKYPLPMYNINNFTKLRPNKIDTQPALRGCSPKEYIKK